VDITRVALHHGAFVLLLIGCSACATRKYSDAILYRPVSEASQAAQRESVEPKQATPIEQTKAKDWSCEINPGDAPPYHIVENHQSFPFSNNPVIIAADSKFSVSLKTVFVGSINDNSPSVTERLDNSFGSNPADRHHFHDKQLWLLSTVTALTPGDVLESSSKHYFRATNIKWQSGAFELLPLDAAENRVFTHTSDASYRIRFQLYEVDDLEFKKLLKQIASDPGIEGLLKALGATGIGLVRGVLGNTTADLIERENHTDEASETGTGPGRFERALLRAGASETFRGEILLVRDPRSFDELYKSSGPQLVEANYLLADVLNGVSKPAGTSLKTYLSEDSNGLVQLQLSRYCPIAKNNPPSETNIGKPPPGGFMQITVGESQSATALASTVEGGRTLVGLQSQIDFLESQAKSIDETSAAATCNVAQPSADCQTFTTIDSRLTGLREVLKDLQGKLTKANNDLSQAIDTRDAALKRLKDQIVVATPAGEVVTPDAPANNAASPTQVLAGLEADVSAKTAAKERAQQSVTAQESDVRSAEDQRKTLIARINVATQDARATAKREQVRLLNRLRQHLALAED
jgi:hypothetical protein